MKNTRNRTKEANSTVSGTCFICNTAQTNDGNIYRGCKLRLKRICTNNEGEIDRFLASAIKKSRYQERETLVEQVVKNRC